MVSSSSGSSSEGLLADTAARPAVPPNGKADRPVTVLSEGDALTGHLRLNGDGHLLGAFEGEVTCDGELLVGKDARVAAAVTSQNVVIAGLVQGNVTASGRLKITSSGRLEGDATVGSLIVQEGGVHRGSIRVHPEGVPEGGRTEQLPSAGPDHKADPAPRARSGGAVLRVKKMWGEFF